MRPIVVQDGLTLTFPGRGNEFDDGVEVGIAASLMALGHNFTMWLSETALEQVKELAQKMDFRVVQGRPQQGCIPVALRFSPRRATLTLVPK